MYRDGLAAGATDLGGTLYHFTPDGKRLPYELNHGVGGYWIEKDYTIKNGDDYMIFDGKDYVIMLNSSPTSESIFVPVGGQGPGRYYEDPAFYINSALGFAGVGLAIGGEMWKTNEIWHIQKNGAVRTAWSALKNNNFVKASKQLSLSKTAGLRSFSNKVAVLSLLATGYGVATTGVVKPSDVLNATMAGISFTGVGSLVSGAYFVADFGFTVFTGKGLGQRLDEAVGSTYKLW